jgi:hypothetical protein
MVSPFVPFRLAGVLFDSWFMASDYLFCYLLPFLGFLGEYLFMWYRVQLSFIQNISVANILLLWCFSISMCDVKIFFTFTSPNMVLLFNYFTYFVPVFQYCYSDSRNLWTVMREGDFGALKSYSTHHFFRNACTKSGSLPFSQFSGCWLIFSVYIIMCFDFPFVRLFGVR